MRHRTSFCAPVLMVLALLGTALGLMAVAPEPDPVPRRWQLDAEVGAMRMTVVNDADGIPHSYLYMTYKVTNNSGQDVLFTPSYAMADDEGHLVPSGRGVPAEATAAIIKSLDNAYLQDQIGIIGLLLQGEQNAKEGIVIWPAPSQKPGELAVYATGLSGETKNYDLKDPATGKMVRSVLHKTLMLRYCTPGELTGRGVEPLEVCEKRWVMR
jgi:hypothetical protein